MKTKTTILIAFVVCLTSCGQDKSEFLEIAVASNKAFLIPADASSCKAIKEAASSAPAVDIQGKYFTVRGLKLFWKHAYNRYDVALIRLKFKSRNINGGEAVCQLGGDDLTALKTGWNGSIEPHSARSFERRNELETDCNLRCGGITTEKKSFSAGGTIEVLGYMTESDGNQVPVKATSSFTVENLE